MGIVTGEDREAPSVARRRVTPCHVSLTGPGRLHNVRAVTQHSHGREGAGARLRDSATRRGDETEFRRLRL